MKRSLPHGERRPSSKRFSLSSSPTPAWCQTLAAEMRGAERLSAEAAQIQINDAVQKLIERALDETSDPALSNWLRGAKQSVMWVKADRIRRDALNRLNG